ncbi:GP29 like protein [Cupriavidus necator]|uniref:PAAR domain-containing protein n=1 Tax=Cupriavidus necator TaxID=106590 RepID=UPI003F73BEB7
MRKGIIRQGDTTTHGGEVLEGMPNFRIHGVPVAAVGHMVSCPQCKGAFPIIEGDTSFTAYGKSIALHGMHTACGAQLISSTSGFANVEHPRGGTGFASAEGGMAHIAGAWGKNDAYDDLYVLQDSSTGTPLPNTEYAVVREGASPEFGKTDGQGRTHLLTSTMHAAEVTIYVEG